MAWPWQQVIWLLLASLCHAAEYKSYWLKSDELTFNTINNQDWHWYQLMVGFNYTEFQGENRSIEHIIKTAVNVEYDAYFDDGQGKMPVVDVWIKNGTLPADWETNDPKLVETCLPTMPVCPWELKFPETTRVTYAMGYNATAIDGLRAEPELLQVSVGIMSKHTAPFTYSIKMSLVPHQLFTGMVVNTSMAPHSERFFSLDIGDFDIVELNLTRLGENLTWWENLAEAKLDNPDHAIETVGHGLTGSWAIRRDHVPTEEIYMQNYPILNTTRAYNISYFCTEEDMKGHYFIGIFSGALANEKTCGQALCYSEREDTFCSQFECKTDREGRGRFVMTLLHDKYMYGDITSLGQLGGCINFNQWRYYTVMVHGEANSTIFAEISSNVSGLYIQQDQRPFDSATMRREGRQEDPDTSRGYAAVATLPNRKLSISPCHLDNFTVWHIAIRLGDPRDEDVKHKGLQPTRFQLQYHTENATLYPGIEQQPLSDGGPGYICCGAFKFHVLHDVPHLQAVRLSLNVTKGHVRATYMKHDSCVRFPEDVLEDECRGLCQMQWYSVFDTLRGGLVYSQEHDFQIGWGEPAYEYNPRNTKRRAGKWYIGIQALSDVPAEYTFRVLLEDPPPRPVLFECNPIDHYCPQEFQHKGLVVENVQINQAPQASPALSWVGVIGFWLCSWHMSHRNR